MRSFLRLSFITQFKIEFLLPFTGCRKVLGDMPALTYRSKALTYLQPPLALRKNVYIYIYIYIYISIMHYHIQLYKLEIIIKTGYYFIFDLQERLFIVNF